MILNPGEIFTVVREIANPNDTDTLYVQAIVRNARNGTTLKTLNLTDQGGQRFTKDYQVPQDASGLGFYISISTRVYTDSGYSSLSENYGQECETYLVDNRFRNAGGGGGGGDEVSYKKIRTIMREELEKLPFPKLEKLIETTRNVIVSNFPVWARSLSLRFSKMQETFVDIGESIVAIEQKEFPKTDLQPLIDAIARIPTDKTDLSPIVSSVRAIETSLNTKEVQSFLETLRTLNEQLASDSLKSIPDLSVKAGDIGKTLNDFISILEKQTQVKRPSSEKPDYKIIAQKLIKRA